MDNRTRRRQQQLLSGSDSSVAATDRGRIASYGEGNTAHAEQRFARPGSAAVRQYGPAPLHVKNGEVVYQHLRSDAAYSPLAFFCLHHAGLFHTERQMRGRDNLAALHHTTHRISPDSRVCSERDL